MAIYHRRQRWEKEEEYAYSVGYVDGKKNKKRNIFKKTHTQRGYLNGFEMGLNQIRYNDMQKIQSASTFKE